VVGSEASDISCFRENSVWLEEEGRKKGKKPPIETSKIPHWSKLPREVADCPLLEMFKTWLDMDLDDIIYSSPFSRKVDEVMSPGPFSLAFFAAPQCFTLEPPRGVFYSTRYFSLLLPLFIVKCSYNPQDKSGSECGSPLVGRWFSAHENV